jgi:hypothetical protein
VPANNLRERGRRVQPRLCCGISFNFRLHHIAFRFSALVHAPRDTSSTLAFRSGPAVEKQTRASGKQNAAGQKQNETAGKQKPSGGKANSGFS